MARIIYAVGACPKGANWDTPLLSPPDAAKSKTIPAVVFILEVDTCWVRVQDIAEAIRTSGKQPPEPIGDASSYLTA